MDRRRFLLTSLAGALAAPLAGSAQPARVNRIGWMNTASAGWHDSAFREGLRELGYVEGRNIVTEWRWVEGKFELLPGVAAQLINLKVDIILAGGTPAALAAQKATTTTPIVMVVAADPVAAGLVTSLARPTGNVTGITRISPELAGKRLELLKETLPKLSRLAILWHDASNPYTMSLLKGTAAAAGGAQLQLQSLEVNGPADLEGAFAAMTKERAGAVIVLQDGLTIRYRARIVGPAGRAADEV